MKTRPSPWALPHRFSADELPWPDHVARIEHALHEGVAVEFCFTREDTLPWFSLRRVGGAIVVLDSLDGHRATVASVDAGLVLGWERGGWIAGADVGAV